MNTQKNNQPQTLGWEFVRVQTLGREFNKTLDREFVPIIALYLKKILDENLKTLR